jgi:hypothetical protein
VFLAMIVNLDSNDMSMALTLAKRFSKKDQWSKKNNEFYRWGAGMINTDKMPYKAELVGIVGEIAFSKVSGLSVDTEYKKSGNSYDFYAQINTSKRDVNIEVKTRLRDYGDVYVKRYDENNRSVNLKSDIYVFCHLKTSWNKIEKSILNQEEIDNIKVGIDGVISKKKLEQQEIKPAFNGTHKNLVCSVDDLAEIDRLINLIK